MSLQSFAPAIFAALAQDRLQKQEEERIKKSQTLNLGSILAGALLGGLTSNRGEFGGKDWMQGALQGGLAGAGSSELEGGVGVAKGAMAGLQQGQNVKSQYIQEMSRKQIEADKNLTPTQKQMAIQYPEIYAKSVFSKQQQINPMLLLLMGLVPELRNTLSPMLKSGGGSNDWEEVK